MRGPGEFWAAYRMRWQRRRCLLRAFRKRRELIPLNDATGGIGAGDVLVFAAVRNEMERLPDFLDHYRKLGAGHFLIADNGSDDGTEAYLAGQPDVSLWRAGGGYKAARFGMDWLTWLMMRHGHGHWCLTVDADELLIYPYWQTRDLKALTAWLDGRGMRAMGALMLDLYPKGPLSGTGAPDWFDSGNYSARRQMPKGNLWVQGGVRARAFFAGNPRRAPTLSKVPLVRWNRRYAYVNSTHSLLPPALNRVYETGGGERIAGVLLHTKFLPSAAAKAREEKVRRQHFGNPVDYDGYYDDLIADPDLWCAASVRLTGWRQLEALGLMSRGGWI